MASAYLSADPVCGHVSYDGVFFPVFKSPTGANTSKLPRTGTRIAEDHRRHVEDARHWRTQLSYSLFDWMTGGIWEGNPATLICNRAAKNVSISHQHTVNDSGQYVDDTGTLKKMLVNDLVFGSHHSGGAQFCFADGSVTFINDEIDFTAFQDMTTIAGDEVNR